MFRDHYHSICSVFSLLFFLAIVVILYQLTGSSITMSHILISSPRRHCAATKHFLLHMSYHHWESTVIHSKEEVIDTVIPHISPCRHLLSSCYFKIRWRKHDGLVMRQPISVITVSVGRSWQIFSFKFNILLSAMAKYLFLFSSFMLD